jgi:phage I-like protein
MRASGAWGFYLRRKDGWTRLSARGSGGAVGHVTFDVPHFVMEQKMMRGIHDRAEQMRQDQVHAFVRHKYQGEATNTGSLVK